MIQEKISNKILTIGPDYRYPSGGIAKLLNTYSQFFNPFNFISTVRIPLNGKESVLRKIGILITGLFRMIRFCCLSGIHIVHVHTASGFTFYRESLFVMLAYLFHKKIVLHIHSGSLAEFYRANPRMLSFIFHRVDRVITIAKVWESFLREEGFTNVTTIGNPIDLPVSYTPRKKSNLNLLFFGKLCDNKGIYGILEMLYEYKASLPDNLQLIVGGNGEVDKFLLMVNDLGLGSKVDFKGWIVGEEKERLLLDTDIYLQPSYTEALGIAILEAMSYRIPVIASHVGGIPEIVHNGRNGILIAPGNKKQLYQAIMQLADNPEERMRLGNNGYEVSKSYYPDYIEKQIEKLYISLLS